MISRQEERKVGRKKKDGRVRLGRKRKKTREKRRIRKNYSV